MEIVGAAPRRGGFLSVKTRLGPTRRKPTKMPLFRVLGQDFEIGQSQLDKAPGCVLAEAAALAQGQAAVPISLEAWPQRDLAVFKVRGQLIATSTVQRSCVRA